MRIKQSKLIHFVIVFIFLTLNAGTIGADIVIVDDSGGANYTSIQDAVNNANNGDTILVYSGLYTENVYVDKELTIKSNSGNPDDTIVQAANSSIHVFDVTADNVTISGFKITGATISYKSGIFLDKVEDCIVTNNILLKNRYGIHLDGSSNNKLGNNTVNSNGGGFWFGESSNNNTLSNNIINSNRYSGIYIYDSDNNTLINNTVSNNEDGIFLGYSSNYNIITNNFLSSNKNGIIATSNTKNNIYNNIVLNNKKPIIIEYFIPLILISIAIALILLRPVIKGYMTKPKYQIISGEGVKTLTSEIIKFKDTKYQIISGEGVKTFTGEIIKFKDIKNLEIAPKSLSRVGINSFSIELRTTLPGYHVGTYYILGLGKVKMISTTWFGTLVIITTDKIRYAISPENPEQFIEKIKSYMDLEIGSF